MKRILSLLSFCLCIVQLFGSPSLRPKGRGILTETPKAQFEIIRKAKEYLLSKQFPDGSWRSENYGLLKSGQSLTPFVLYALSDTIEKQKSYQPEWVEKSMNFLRSKGNDEGIHGRDDPDFLDYPNYATSYAMLCFLRFGKQKDYPTIKKMIHYLQTQQFSEDCGFSPKDTSYGGWGFGISTRPTLASFVDLAHTRRVLQALSKADALTQVIQNRARIFLGRLQKRKAEKYSIVTGPWSSGIGYDGGFFSSPTIAYANKGRMEKDENSGKEFFRSYSTATCDGLLSMVALAEDENSRFVKDASKWLEQNGSWENPSGIPHDDPAPWNESMTLYNIMVQAEAFTELNLNSDWKENLIRLLRTMQLDNGSFTNTNGKLMKEDDPLIGTAYILISLRENTKN